MMNEQIVLLIQILQKEKDLISEKRRGELTSVAKEIRRLRLCEGVSDVIFVCTHNSRRSQLAELWLRTLGQYFEIKNVNAFSGGTEVTSFNYRMVAALQRAGFTLHSEDTSVSNPVYKLIQDSEDAHVMFSKKYDDPFNPLKNFIAIMVCSEADAACPVIPGAFSRIALPYVDPKNADDTELEVSTYDEKVREIGRELIYVASLIKNI